MALSYIQTLLNLQAKIETGFASLSAQIAAGQQPPPVVQPPPLVETTPEPTPVPAPSDGTVILSEDFKSYANGDAFRTAYTGKGPDGYDRILTLGELYSIDTAHPFEGHQTLRARQVAGTLATPQNELYFAPRGSVEIGVAIRFEPGWTTNGTPPATSPGASEGYKVIGGGWDSADGRLCLEIVGIEYQLSLDVKRGTSIINVGRCGLVGSEWRDGLFHDFRIRFRRISEHTGVAELWIDGVFRGSVQLDIPDVFPMMNRVHYGQNINQQPEKDQFLNYGKWYVRVAA